MTHDNPKEHRISLACIFTWLEYRELSIESIDQPHFLEHTIDRSPEGRQRRLREIDEMTARRIRDHLDWVLGDREPQQSEVDPKAI